MILGSTREPFLGQPPPSGTAQRPESKTSLSEEKAYLPLLELWLEGQTSGPKHSLPPRKGLGGGGLYEDSYTGSLCALPLPCSSSHGVSPKRTYLLAKQPKFSAWYQRTLLHCLGSGGQWGLCLWVPQDFNQGKRSS